MSEALYDLGGLRFWSEDEIRHREACIDTLRLALTQTLQALNPAWTFHRVDGPVLTPRYFVSPAYDEGDLFLLQAPLGDDAGTLRAETTASSYLYAKHLLESGKARAPLCVWQAGKSFRRETNDGARASELRFNEFYQCEFQCIFREGTKADYRDVAEAAVARAILRCTGQPTRMVDSDRLPAYSTQTRDIEVAYGDKKWKEMASISTRTDFPLPGHLVLEVAVGLDRLVAVEKDRS